MNAKLSFSAADELEIQTTVSMSLHTDKQKVKSFKVAALFSALIVEIEYWCQLGSRRLFLGSTKKQFCRNLWVLLLDLTDLCYIYYL